MATTYTGKVKANFKTAYLQRELTIELPAKDTVVGHIGEVYKIDSNGELARVEVTGKSTSAAAIADAKAAVAVGQYILAQSDYTTEYGHVPVENRNYAYSDAVNMTDSVKRKFVVFRINNLDDINIEVETTAVTV